MIDETAMQNNQNGLEQRLHEIERRLAEKESQLRDRDRTVLELTDRLSQTAERLDRVRRVGSEHEVMSTQAFPKEVVEQQRELVDDLQRAVQMWENMQLACGLGGLQMQLADLHALFEEHFREPEPEPVSEPEPEVSPSGDAVETLEAEQQQTGIAEPEPASELKLDGPLVEDLQPLPEEDFLLGIDEVCPLRPPEILNLTEAGEEDLRRCAEQQEAYIDYLSARLQRVAEKKTAVDWQSLASHPEKLLSQLEYTATKIQQSRHFAEYELALQRTRLKRKERELKTLSEGLSLQMQSADRSPAAEQDKYAPGGRRWMRMLGMGKQESE